jgi:hypothetical protein
VLVTYNAPRFTAPCPAKRHDERNADKGRNAMYVGIGTLVAVILIILLLVLLF